MLTAGLRPVLVAGRTLVKAKGVPCCHASLCSVCPLSVPGASTHQPCGLSSSLVLIACARVVLVCVALWPFFESSHGILKAGEASSVSWEDESVIGTFSE